MKHLRKYNEGQRNPQREFPDYQPKFQGEKETAYQAFLFACYSQHPNDFSETNNGKLIDERNIYLSDFEDWWDEGCIVPHMKSERP